MMPHVNPAALERERALHTPEQRLSQILRETTTLQSRVSECATADKKEHDSLSWMETPHDTP
jgi:hypothetical protein